MARFLRRDRVLQSTPLFDGVHGEFIKSRGNRCLVVWSKNSIVLKTQGIGPPGPNRVKTTLGVRRRFPGDVTLCYVRFGADFPEQCAHPATIIRLKQIQFLDHTAVMSSGRV